MKKISIMLLLVTALSGTAFAGEGFVKNEADRSGTTGTGTMANNSIHGFFASLGKFMPHKVAHTDSAKATQGK